MKSVNARAGNPDITQIPLTSFDKNSDLNACGGKLGESGSGKTTTGMMVMWLT